MDTIVKTRIRSGKLPPFPRIIFASSTTPENVDDDDDNDDADDNDDDDDDDDDDDNDDDDDTVTTAAAGGASATQGWESSGFHRNSGFLMVPRGHFRNSFRFWEKIFLWICTL